MIDVTPTLEALRDGRVSRYAALLAIAEQDFARRGESPDLDELAAHFHCSVISLYRWRRELREASLSSEQLDTAPVLRQISLALQRRQISPGAYSYGRHLVEVYLNTDPNHRFFCGCFPAAATVVASMARMKVPGSVKSVSRWKGELAEAEIIRIGPRFWHKADNVEFEALRDNPLYREGLGRLYARICGQSPAVGQQEELGIDE